MSQTRFAVPTSYLTPSPFVAYSVAFPPLTPHLAESVPLLCEQPCACRKAAISRGVFNHSPSRLLSFGNRLARLRAYPVIEFSQSVMRLRKSLIRIVFGVRRRTSSLTPTLCLRLRRTSQKAFRFSANSHARAAKRQFRAAYSITPHRDFSLSESVSPACGQIPSLSFLNRS